MKTEVNKLKQKLEQFYGTEKYHRITIFNLLATDGVAYFAEQAEAYWLMDLIGAKCMKLAGKEDFIVVKVTVEGSKAIIEYEDGNDKVLARQRVEYTDLEGNWKFFVINNIIMLPSEY